MYGEDDRLDVADHPNAELRALATSIVTFVRRAQLGGASFAVSGSTLGDNQALCSGERFAEQISAGFCSGTLIGPDLVLTAGHCIESEAQCRQTSLLFNYQWTGGGLGALTEDDVYQCRRVIAQDLVESAEVRDYAVIQLDRPVSGRAPAEVIGHARAARGRHRVRDRVALGIPMKIDDGGRVRDPRPNQGDYFVGTPDSFGGNSGSGIFDLQTRALIGMLISGETDYVSDGSCQRVNVCTEDGCGGENMLYPGMALDDFCAQATDPFLCGSTGILRRRCAASEAGGCAEDCEPIVCGNAWCEGDEWSTCPEDCEAGARQLVLRPLLRQASATTATATAAPTTPTAICPSRC